MMKNFKKYFALAGVLFLASGSVACSMQSDEKKSGANPPAQTKQEGQRIDELKLTTLEGESITVKGEGDGVLILNFWATWCPPCQGEVPDLAAFAKEYPKVRFYAIDLQENANDVKDFLGKMDAKALPAYLDLSGEVAKAFRISAIPTTLVAAPDGTIIFRKTGPVTKEELEQIVAEAKK